MNGAQSGDQQLLDLVSRDFVTAAARVYGRSSQSIVTTLLSAVVSILERVDPTSLQGRLLIAHRPAIDSSASIKLASLAPTHAFGSAADVPPTLTQETLIDVSPVGRLKVYSGIPISPADVSQGGISYFYEAGVERIFVNGVEYLIQNPTGTPSVFIRSTYGSLEAALRTYRLKFVRYSTCYLFKDVWVDPKRLFLRNRPEEGMRRSLTNFLRAHLDAEVMPEQNVDETHPIDIKVTFPLTDRRALIEIKWMGASVTASGGLLRYGGPRARKGSVQLAEYLDWIQTSEPLLSHRGYLVVIDARRKGLAPGVTSIIPDRANFFERRSVRYDAAILGRADFAHPRRLFATAIAP